MAELWIDGILAPRNYAEYLQTSGDERWEIIDGVPYNMTPAPSTKHQMVSTNLLSEFATFLKGKQCRVFGAPFDVRLFATEKKDNEIKNVVQPDLSIICDKSKLDERGCNGAPDLIVEILSPSSIKRDRMEKLHLYRKAKVREYWIVDTDNETIEIYRFNEDPDRFPDIHLYARKDNDRAPVGIFEDFEVDLQDVFA